MMTDYVGTAIKIKSDKLFILDQRLLPSKEVWIRVKSPKHMTDLIKSLAVRGAPLIGVAAALSLALTGNSVHHRRLDEAEKLISARPTAINLAWAVNKMKDVLRYPLSAKIVAEDILAEDIDMCQRIGDFGSSIIKDGDQILTHCNAGSLATAGIGTALACFTQAKQQGKRFRVYVDETRPLLQGARLTAWELGKAGIDHTVLCDNMAASLMPRTINRVIVGADRIATNGDFANKIGTYGVAILAKYHNIPFHIAAPKSTIDFNCKTGKDIQIEYRDASEVRGFRNVIWTPKKSRDIYNPSFDVTPRELVTSYILDCGIFTKEKIIKKLHLLSRTI